MKNTFVLHIGMPKTGTTALQHFLFENADILREYGWIYPNLKKDLQVDCNSYTGGGEEKNGDCFLQAIDSFDPTASNWIRAWKKIRQYLKDYNVVVSAEELFACDIDELLSEIINSYENIKVIVYLRRQDRYVESYWNEEVKTNACTSQRFHDMIKYDLDRVKHIHYLEWLDHIGAIIGEENIIVRVYEKAQFVGEKNNLASDFLEMLGIKPDWTILKPIMSHNRGLSGNFVEIKRIFNSVLKQNDIEGASMYSELFKDLSAMYKSKEKEEAYFELEERIKFLKLFEEENQEIARKYLNRPDGILFYDRKVDYPSTLAKATPFEEDMIRTFAYILYAKELQFKKPSQVVKIDTILQNRGDRKIIYFGAGKKCCEMLKYINLPVYKIVDNDERKAGTFIDNIEIVWAKNIEDWSKYFVVVTCMKTDDMEEQLSKMGLQKEKDYILAKEWFGWLNGTP